MEVLSFIVDIVKTRPDLFIVIFPLSMWWLERSERKEQFKTFMESQTETAQALSNVKETMVQGNMLLQELIRRN